MHWPLWPSLKFAKHCKIKYILFTFGTRSKWQVGVRAVGQLKAEYCINGHTCANLTAPLPPPPLQQGSKILPNRRWQSFHKLQSPSWFAKLCIQSRIWLKLGHQRNINKICLGDQQNINVVANLIFYKIDTYLSAFMKTLFFKVWMADFLQKK